MIRYVVVVSYGLLDRDRAFDCILDNAMFLTRKHAQARIDECTTEDKARLWTYRYKIIRVKE